MTNAFQLSLTLSLLAVLAVLTLRAFFHQLGQFEPGMYAIEVLGELPEDAIEHCENFELEYRAKAKQNK